ncbi:UPAR/Ly6 domain-containing protein crok-like isoform X2 [Rhynchophorus ferrugineus]|uniref:UPAR/Ly6 domain-containing protein crok-like isoform X2 n=1 Tax=Rhynchophorus ferrugineus TaxID=354439 RepID=UPI003FCE2AD1
MSGGFSGTVPVNIFVGLLVKLLICSAVAEKNVVFTSDDYWKNETPLQCYDCNSEYDPRCGDPFNSYTIGIVNCSDIKPPEHLLSPDMLPNQRLKPTVCRKIVQWVEGKKRVIRECGYIQDDRDNKNCLKTTGTKNVDVKYCACTKPLCNGGVYF